MNPGVQLWAFIGTFYLIWLTWQDYRNNMRVDDRRNFFMMGVSIAIYAWYPRGILYAFAVMGLMLLWVWVAKKYSKFGVADIHSFAWIFLAFAIINPVLLGAFAVLIGVATAGWLALKNYLLKHKGPLPFYGVIAVLFIAFNLVFGLYS